MVRDAINVKNLIIMYLHVTSNMKCKKATTYVTDKGDCRTVFFIRLLSRLISKVSKRGFA